LNRKAIKARAAGLAGAVLAGMLATAVPAGATFPGENGFLVASGAIGSQSGLFGFRPDGSGLGILSGTEGGENGAWSASGRRIAYSKVVDGNEDVYAITPTGSEVRVTNDIADDFDPAYSPDGQEIVFVSNREGNNELYVIDAAGTIRRLTNNTVSDTQPTWSSTNVIAFTQQESGQNTTEIHTINPNGTGEDALTVSNQSSSDPNFSPDGTKVLFTRPATDAFGNDELFTVDFPSGVNLLNLSNTPDREEHDGIWSPDGTKIAFLTGYLATEIDVRSIASFGGNETLVLDNTSLESIDWQALCDTCDTKTTVEVKYKGNKLIVNGRVSPPHPSSEVKVSLYKKVRKKLSKISSKTVALDSNSAYKTTLARVDGKQCKVKVLFAGDDDHYGSLGVTPLFPC
jgi:dipeptidyl aminopeptidase/acylaminoacyl peptidase